MAATAPARHNRMTGICTLEIRSRKISRANRLTQMGEVRLSTAISACRAPAVAEKSMTTPINPKKDRASRAGWWFRLPSSGRWLRRSSTNEIAMLMRLRQKTCSMVPIWVAESLTTACIREKDRAESSISTTA